MYYGFVGLKRGACQPDASAYPAVLSIGYNPVYKNTTRSVEIHILHNFDGDFYGASLNLLILGFIRPEYDYPSLESLIDDIKTDCEVARRSLDRATYRSFETNEWLFKFSWASEVDVDAAEARVLRKQ